MDFGQDARVQPQAEAIEAKVGSLRELAWDYGKSTNQGEVGILLENADGDWFFTIPMSEDASASEEGC